MVQLYLMVYDAAARPGKAVVATETAVVCLDCGKGIAEGLEEWARRARVRVDAGKSKV